ncbi:MAG: DUF6504 family protein [Actinomycetota bacterium]
MSKRYDEPIEVEIETGKADGLREAVENEKGAYLPGPTLLAFHWRERRYRIDRLLKYWRVAKESEAPERFREYFRVEAEDGIYDLRLDRVPPERATHPAGKPRWRLVRVWD